MSGGERRYMLTDAIGIILPRIPYVYHKTSACTAG